MDTITAEPIVAPSQATPAPAPEVSSTPTPTTAPETPAAAVTPAAEAKPTGEEAKPEFKPGTDPREHLKSVLKYNADHAAKPTGEEKKPEAEVKTEPAKTEPVVEKAEEQKTAEAKAAEEAEKAKTAEQKPEPSPFDKSGPLPAEKLAATLAEDKALDTALAGKVIKLDDGREINLKDAIFESSRIAAQAAPMLELFPTIEAAQEAEQGARVFFDLDTKFPAIKDMDSYDTFMMDTLVPLSFLRDAEGKPIPNPDIPGTYKTDGSVDRFVRLTADVELDQVGKIADLMAKNDATKEYGEDLAAAAKFIAEFRQNGYKMPGAPGEKPAITPEVQQRLDRADRIEREAKTRETQQQQQAHDSFEEKVTDATFEQVTPLIETTLNKTSLSDYEKGKVAEDVWKDLTAVLDKNALWKRGREQMMSRRDLSDAVRQRRVAHNLSYMKSVLTGILDTHITKAGAKRIQASQERQQKTASQIEQSKMEPRSGATVATATPGSLTGDGLHQKAIENARAANGGREPSNTQILTETLKLKKVFQQSA